MSNKYEFVRLFNFAAESGTVDGIGRHDVGATD